MTTGYSSEHATFPRWPYVLSLIAGALILMEGVIVAIAGTAYTVYSFGAGVTALAIGITGVMFGIVADPRGDPIEDLTGWSCGLWCDRSSHIYPGIGRHGRRVPGGVDNGNDGRYLGHPLEDMNGQWNAQS